LVADFFCGGGTTAAVAQRLNRNWIMCDQSRVAVAITADRLTKQVEDQSGKILPVSDFTVEHWGVYEMRRLAETPPDQFRLFVLRAFGAVPEEKTNGFHGSKGAIPVWIGEPDQKRRLRPKMFKILPTPYARRFATSKTTSETGSCWHGRSDPMPWKQPIVYVVSNRQT
jgi:hypothetical protein